MKERPAFALPGIPIVLAATAVTAVTLCKFTDLVPLLAVPAAIVGVILLKGVAIVQPNQALVLTFLGKYCGSVTQNGLWWVNPLAGRQHVSLKITNFRVSS